MTALEIGNSAIVWIMCLLTVGVVLLYLVVFMVKGWKHAAELGVPKEKLKKVLTSCALLSIVPSFPIAAGFLVLAPILGKPYTWLRLSVIGDAASETLSATMGAEAAGEVLGAGMSAQGLFCAYFVMGLAGALVAGTAVVVLRPIDKAYGKFSKGSMATMAMIGLAALYGVLANVAVSYCATTTPALIITAVGIIFAYALKYLGTKHTVFKKLDDYSLAICMVIGMTVAYFIA